MRKKPVYHKFRYWHKPNAKKGIRNAASKIDNSIVNYLRANWIPWRVTIKTLAEKVGISTGHARNILANRYWINRTPVKPRRNAGVVERARLESERGRNAPVGSNPTFSDSKNIEKGAII